MCTSPVRIRNPNYKSKLAGAKLKDTTSFYLNIPCGCCPQCIASKQMSFVQRVQMEQIDNHLFFCTLTYNNDMIPKIKTSSGYEIKFADVHDLQNMFKRLRKNNSFGRSFRYMYVSELGGKRGRPHFHLIFLIPKFEGDDFNTCLSLERLMFDEVLKNWSRNIGTRKNPIYKPCCTYIRKMVFGKLSTTFDLHYVNPISTANDVCDVGFYVTKYLLKPSTREVRLQRALKLNLPSDEFDEIWNKVKPRVQLSHFFGCSSDAQKNYIRKCVKNSFGEDFPKFFNPITGKSFPLSRYYKSRGDCFTLDDLLKFPRPDNNCFDREISTKQEEDKVISQFNKRLSLVDENDSSFIFNKLLDYAD